MVMVGLGKRGAEWMEGPVVVEEPQCSPTGSRETNGGHTTQAVPEVAQGTPPRRLWSKHHTSVWWEELKSLSFLPEKFKRAFCMSRRTLNMLCVELTPAICMLDTQQRDAIPILKRVTICIWCLASGETLLWVATRFALGTSTCHKLSLEVCTAITSLLMPKVVQWPEGPLTTAAAAQFEAAYRILNVLSTVYSTHFPIIQPQSDALDYLNSCRSWKGERSYSVMVQAVVNASGFFTDICVGQPGSLSDEDMLSKSSLAKLHSETGMILAQDKWLLGGASYPVTDWMLAPYAGNNLTFVQHGFNERVAGVLRLAKNTFMRLKARWSLLKRRSDMKIDDFNITLDTCCMLHNIYEIYGDTFDPDLAFDLLDDKMLPTEQVLSAAAMKVRDHIANMLFNHGGGVVMP